LYLRGRKGKEEKGGENRRKEMGMGKSVPISHPKLQARGR